MIDLNHLPSAFRGDVQIFGANSISANVGWSTWNKPRGCTMAFILGLGAGSNGANGVVGSNSAAAGGSGGGSGAQTSLLIPLIFLPDLLFLSVCAANGQAATRVAIAPNTVANNCLLIANSASTPGTSVTGTPGVVGVGGVIATLAGMPLAGLGVCTFFAGQDGSLGGAALAGADLVLPVTGLTVTAGMGGGGLPAAGQAGRAGGSLTVTGEFPPHPGGAAQSTATLPGVHGSNGPVCAFRGLEYSYGGAGGGGSHGTATGAGLFGGKGGNGGPGCGGGGGGACLTGGTVGLGGLAGDGQVTIICW